MTLLAVAAVSARMLAEAAAQDGYGVVALDLFGDADTRRAAEHWVPIGTAGPLRIDSDRVLGALQQLARLDADDVIGWVPGGGFEALPDLIEAGARVLPMIGTSADAVRRVRDHRAFFAALTLHGIAHPTTRVTPPTDAQGWLRKDANGCGGWHIRRAGVAPVDVAGDAPGARPDAANDAPTDATSVYFQREMPGVPMSATFIADGTHAMVVGTNELIVRPIGARPHVYGGCIGPVTLAPELARYVNEAVRALTKAFDLRGWCSLDFIRDGDVIGVLEVNPRPPASLALYAQRGVIDAHLRACLHAELPRPGAFAARQVTGHEIVYARNAFALDRAGAQHLASRADAHDLPAAGTRFAVGDPICSLGAAGRDAGQVKARLAAARDGLIKTLETPR